MKYYELDKEEKKILRDFERGEYGEDSAPKAELEKYRQYAKAFLKKTRNVNIRLAERDLRKVKAKAVSKGIPYQTLLASLIHQYADDRFNI